MYNGWAWRGIGFLRVLSLLEVSVVVISYDRTHVEGGDSTNIGFIWHGWSLGQVWITNEWYVKETPRIDRENLYE